jgi:WD40 repeat protein
MGFSSESNVLISGSRDGNVHFWDTNENCSFLGNGVGLMDQVSCIEVSHDGKRVAVGSWDQTLVVYEI